MPHAIVGTAGHVDHGKTRLVEALTGIDCDRLAEEKARGITIDLGFAHLAEGAVEVGFVDVPGHQRFLHNALAGLGGVRVMLLVVAADEGVRAQTREHLAICALLGVPAAIVALAKSDLVGEERLAEVREAVAALLAATPFAGAPILATSSRTGAGIGELRAALLELARRHAVAVDPDRPARLPIDRAFQLKGLGLVVTGTLAGGTVAPGDALELLPAGGSVRVRGVQVHGRQRERAEAGERTALQLAGVAAEQVARGMELVEPGVLAPTSRLLARLDLLAEAGEPLRGEIEVRLHLYAADAMGRLRPLGGPIEPGESGLVELRLAHPVVAARGDRFVLRRPSPPATLGGGSVLDPLWRPRRGRAREEEARRLAGDEATAAQAWAEAEGAAGIGVECLTGRLGLRAAAAESRLAKLAAEGRLVPLPAGPGHGPRWLAPAPARQLAERAERLLAEYFASDRLAQAMPRAELASRLLPGSAAGLADGVLPWLARQGRIALAGDRVTLPGREASLTEIESSLAARLLARLESAGLQPPSPRALASELASKPQMVEGVLRYLVQQGRLARLPDGLLVASAAVEGLCRDLEPLAGKRISVGDFKARYGLSRKWAIPLLEHLDSIGVTRRLGDERLVVGGAARNPPGGLT